MRKGTLLTILALVVLCGAVVVFGGDWIGSTLRSMSSSACTNGATWFCAEVAQPEPPVVNQPVAVINPKAILEVSSVKPHPVEVGKEVKVIFKVSAFADNTTVVDYSFILFAANQTTPTKTDLVPEKEFVIKAPSEVGTGKVIGYVQAVHKTNPALSSDKMIITVDTKAVEAPVKVEPKPATEAPAAEAVQPENAQTLCPGTVTINPPNNAVPFPKEVGFGFSLNNDNPEPFAYPCGTFVWVAMGNGNVNGTVFTAGEDEINIVYNLCSDPKGCAVTVKDLTAGHAYIGVTYAWLENPEDTLKFQISSGFTGQNCGEGCNKVFTTDLSGKNSPQTYVNVGDYLNGFALGWPIDLKLLEQQMKVAVVGGPPLTSEDIVIDKVSVGYTYNLEKGATHVGIPEGISHGALFDCRIQGCNINGVEIPKGSYAKVYGILADGTTPKDLNYTVTVSAGDVTTIQVWFIYGTKLENFVPAGANVIEVHK